MHATNGVCMKRVTLRDKGTLMSVSSAISTATRHMMDVDIAFGRPSSRYNARNAYRTNYDSSERYAAGVGVAFGTAVPALGLTSWARRGLRMPGEAAMNAERVAAGATRFPSLAKVAGAGVLAGMTVAGGIKVKQLVEDDGHLGSVGSVAGLVGGFAAMSAASKLRGIGEARIAGVPLAPVLGLGAAVAGGIGGYYAGKQVHVGDRNIGQPIANATKTHDSLPGSMQDFTRGAFNHFTEVGPTSQGVSFAYRWGMRNSFETEYSKSERAGAMTGDLAAAAILGGGALAASRQVLNMAKGTRVTQLGTLERLGSNLSMSNAVLGTVGEMPFMKAAREGMSRPALVGGLATLGAIGAGLTYINYRDAVRNGNQAVGTAYAAGTVAAGGIAGLAATRYLARSGVAAGPRAVAGAATAAVIISAMSAARMPVQQFINDARSVHKVDGSGSTGANVAFGVAGGAIGATSGFRIASKFAESATGSRKALIMGAGTLVGLAAGGGAGLAMAPLSPDLKHAAVGAGIGAGVGALAGAGLAGAKALPLAVAGGAIGLIGSSMIGSKSSS